VIYERKTVARTTQQEHKQIADSAQIERLDSIDRLDPIPVHDRVARLKASEVKVIYERKAVA
jgi:hypothetical protein